MIIFIKCHNSSAKIFSHLLINFLPPHWDVPLIRLMLEFLDSMWINEIYRNQRINLWKIVKQEIEDLHTIERFKELETKKPIIKKIINLIH